MRKVKLNGTKLQLNKDRVADLSNKELNNVLGGGILWSRIGCCKSTSVEQPPNPQTQTVKIYTQDGAEECTGTRFC